MMFVKDKATETYDSDGVSPIENNGAVGFDVLMFKAVYMSVGYSSPVRVFTGALSNHNSLSLFAISSLNFAQAMLHAANKIGATLTPYFLHRLKI